MEEGELFQNKYRIGRLLGEGGMGVVYAAVQEPSGLRVAIKFVSARNAKARNLQGERLIREARVLAKLNHGNLVRLYDFDRTPAGDYFIVMEHVEGDTLRTLISRARKQGRGLDSQQVLHVMAQVAEGMSVAHRAGVVHRDLKPDNIMVLEGSDLVVRVVDFGLAKNPVGGSAPGAAGAETNPAHVVGTTRYMAPEQVRGHEIDERTDIYAMGVTMYEALTGHNPYVPDGDSVEETEMMARHCFAEPTPVVEHVPNCPERVSSLVLRCLAKDPAARYQSARDLARDIRTMLAEEAKAQQREHKSGVKEARETEPIAVGWKPGAALPFVGRSTEPMPPPGPGGAPQPTYAAVQATIASAQQAPGRGVGYTTKIARPSSTALAAAEQEVALARAASPSLVADPTSPSGVLRSGAASQDSDAETTPDRASPTRSPSASGTQLKPASAATSEADAAFARRNEPVTMSTRQSLSGASLPQPTRASRSKVLGVPPMLAAPIVGSALAALVLLIVVLRRAPAQSDAPRATATTTTAAASAPPTSAATAQDAPTSTTVPTASANSSPTSGSATAATARPTATPRSPVASAKPSDRIAPPKPTAMPPGDERKPAVPTTPAPAPTPANGRLFGVDR